MIDARREEIEEYEEEVNRARWAEFYRMSGIGLFVFGTIWLVVPFYKVICEKAGINVTTHAKDYHFPESQSKELSLTTSENPAQIQSKVPL